MISRSFQGLTTGEEGLIKLRGTLDRHPIDGL